MCVVILLFQKYYSFTEVKVIQMCTAILNGMKHKSSLLCTHKSRHLLFSAGFDAGLLVCGLKNCLCSRMEIFSGSLYYFVLKWSVDVVRSVYISKREHKISTAKKNTALYFRQPTTKNTFYFFQVAENTCKRRNPTFWIRNVFVSKLLLSASSYSRNFDFFHPSDIGDHHVSRLNRRKPWRHWISAIGWSTLWKVDGLVYWEYHYQIASFSRITTLHYICWHMTKI
jgi:hypothetical protein